ncbi:hypothetical protein [Streptomyces sp. NPDC001508]|uniref:hypothetical protein n=1 Tax=Streptomyces sp. NPDC001508 TaxID=3154656 RepID=UPI00332F2AFB
MHVSVPASVLDELEQLAVSLRRACDEHELLDASGKVPSPAPTMKMLQHVATAQNLSRITMQLVTEFMTQLDNPPQLLVKAQSHLLAAVAHACNAPALYARAAQTTALPAATAGELEAEQRKFRMIFDHAEARSELQLASEAVRDATREVKRHHDTERFLARVRGPAPANAASPPGPKPKAR